MNQMRTLKVKLYSYIVNTNPYVSEAYHLPIEVDKEYHNKHRCKEWIRLFKLLWRFRILDKTPTEYELEYWEELKKLKYTMQEYIADKPPEFDVSTDNCECNRDISVDRYDNREVDVLLVNADKELNKVTKKLCSSDFIRNTKKIKILLLGNEEIKRYFTTYAIMRNEYCFVHLCTERKEDTDSIIPVYYNPFCLNYIDLKCQSIGIEMNNFDVNFIEYYPQLKMELESMLEEYPEVNVKVVAYVLSKFYCLVTDVIDIITPQYIVYDATDNLTNILIQKILDEKNIKGIQVNRLNFEESKVIEFNNY